MAHKKKTLTGKRHLRCSNFRNQFCCQPRLVYLALTLIRSSENSILIIASVFLHILYGSKRLSCMIETSLFCLENSIDQYLCDAKDSLMWILKRNIVRKKTTQIKAYTYQSSMNVQILQHKKWRFKSNYFQFLLGSCVVVSRA